MRRKICWSRMMELLIRAPRPDEFIHWVRRRVMFSRTDLSDRKSTRLNSSHRTISYAVFCLKKKKIKHQFHQLQVRQIPRQAPHLPALAPRPHTADQARYTDSSCHSTLTTASMHSLDKPPVK